jgi:hypothetical protein
VIAMFVAILGFVLLICMWAMGDQEFRTKAILTVVYLALWGLLFVHPTIGYVAFAGHCLRCIVVGYWTFGSSFKK